MAFRVGFHKTLFKLGKWRFGIGYSSRGAAGIIMVCTYAILNLCWYMVVGCLWLVYGFIWLCFVLPIKGIAKLVENIKNNQSNQEA